MYFTGPLGAALLVLVLGGLALFIYFASGLFGPRQTDELPEYEPDPTEFEGENDDTCYPEADATASSEAAEND